MYKVKNITLSEFITALSEIDSSQQEKKIESVGIDSRDNIVIRFTDKDEVKIKRTVKM